ncbi:unnamed protein product [Effrenium voratum]|nr:unnamed protein product [Effrenium voratum]
MALAAVSPSDLTPAKQSPKVRRDNSWRETKLVEVTGEQFAALARGSDLAVPRRNRGARVRFPPLEAWRGERVVFERPPGSKTPQMRGVVLNTAADPGLASWAERARAKELEAPETPLALEWETRSNPPS